MNVSKSMMKVDLAKSFGSQFADMAKAVEADERRQEGARDALKLAAQRVGMLGLQLDKSLEDGELSVADLKDPLKVQVFIKRWVKRAVGVLDNLATTAEVARMDAVGRMKGLRAAESVVQAVAQAEVTRLQELQRSIDSGEMTLDEVQRPGAPLSLKHQREDEAAAKAVEATSVPEVTSSESVNAAPPPQGVEKASRSRSRKKATPKKSSQA